MSRIQWMMRESHHLDYHDMLHFIDIIIMNKSIIQRCLYSVCCGFFCLLSSFCVYAQEGIPSEDPKDKVEDTSLYKAINAV